MSGRTTVRSDRSATERTQVGAELEPGRNVGRYVTLGPVGRGATGVVYRAYDPELDR